MEWMIKVNLSLILIALVGGFWERRDRRFQMQRMITLFSIAMVLILPLVLQIPVEAISSQAIPVIVLPEFVVAGVEPEIAQSALNFYLVGLYVALFVLAVKLVLLWINFRKRADQTWSFFGVIRIDSRLEGAARSLALAHEKVHKRQLHSLDVLLMELLKAAFWFNPAVYIIKDRLCRLHEYLADEETGSEDLSLYKQTLINEAMSIPSGVLSNEFARRSTLLKRFEMMERNNNMRGVRLLGLVLALFGGIFIITACETSGSEEVADQGETAIVQVDARPEYNGGMQQLMTDLGQTVVYPESAKDAGIEGTVYVSFVVDEQGLLGKAEVVRGVDEQLDEAALKAVNNLPNDWSPGVSEGKSVPMEMKLPIRFVLE